MLLSDRMRRSPSPPPVSGSPTTPSAAQREPFVATPSFVWGHLPENDPLVLMPHRRPTRNPPPIDNRPSFKVLPSAAVTAVRGEEEKWTTTRASSRGCTSVVVWTQSR
jgi:hypothetical protein